MNQGYKPQYYIEDHHEGIVFKEDFEKVQEILQAKSFESKKGRIKRYPFTSRVVCSSCGKNFHRFKNHKGKVSWRCHSSQKSKLLCNTGAIDEERIEKLLIEGFEKRYNMNQRSNDGLLIKQLIKELDSAEGVREREQNLLRVELEKCLIAENKAILQSLDIEALKERRKAVEDEIFNKTKLWEEFDKDHAFREASLNRLKDLNGSDKGIKNILDISFMRAWVIRITVESPFLFTIKWIDGEETVVGKLKGGLINASK